MTEEDLNEINRAVRDIRRGPGEKVFHGLGITRLSPKWFTRLQLDSCDSTAYLRPKKYGDVIIYQNNTVHTHTIDGDDVLRKSLLKKYAPHWKQNGLDTKLILKMDSTEMAKTGILAFRFLQERLWDRARATAPKFFDPEWGTGALEEAEEDDEPRVTSINGQALMHVVIEDADIDFDGLTSMAVVDRVDREGDTRLADAFDHMMKPPLRSAEAPGAPPGTVIFSVPGIASAAVATGIEMVRAVLDTSMHNTEDIEVACATYFAHVYPVTQAPVYLQPSGATAALVAPTEEDYDPTKRSRVVGKLLRTLPQVVCDTCNINTNCPEFKERSVCAYNSLYDKLSVRDIDNVIPVVEALADASVSRALRAAAVERANGGSIDSRTGAAIADGMKSIQQLQALRDAHHASEESMTLSVRTSGKNRGILSKLFGGTGAARPALEESTVIVLPSQSVETAD